MEREVNGETMNREMGSGSEALGFGEDKKGAKGRKRLLAPGARHCSGSWNPGALGTGFWLASLDSGSRVARPE